MAKKCPKCGQEMTEAGDNEERTEKDYYCFDCDIWIRKLPNGFEIVRDM
jgi:predicted RNA-binding Zn-ribbon protein involved in translation (DUF1610 family)